LMSDSEFGLDITICIKEHKLQGINIESTIQTRHNCTEFHHRYNNSERVFGETCSAFESDIHGTGGTMKIDIIEWIRVDSATKLNENY